ncbi:MAG TPA: C13 family peptidase, partial [Fimbriimonadaceae bacterium]|nr:C13 family peptidase [Fimbriimonadaceae bacterium]
IRMLDAQGKQSDFAKVPYQDMSLAPFGSKLLIGDRRGKTVFTFDTETKRSTQLLKLDEIRMEPKSVPPDSLLRLGTLNSIGSDGKTVYLGIGAGFSSAIFQVDPASKRVLNRQWAGSPDPHDIAFGDGSVFVLNPQYSEVRRFSEDLQRTSHKFDTETKGSFGMAIQGQNLLFLHPDGQTLLRQNPDPKFLLKSTLNSSLVLATNPRFINRAWINPGIINLLLPQKYAVLICGDKAEDFAGECFWNDTIWMYKQLINNGYSAHNIFVCYGDGADYHSANPFYQYSHNIVNFAGTYNAVAQLLTGLKNGDATNHIPAMRSQDSLFVWTFDHGGTWGLGQDYIYLSGIGMSVTDFATRANAIPYSTRSIFMQQCFSGGFIPVLQNATTFIGTACNAAQEAYPGGGTESYGGKTYNHGGFNYYVIGAMAHAYPNGTPVNADSNHDGHRSSLELYQFAAANNTLPENPEDANLGSVGANFWFK